MRAQKRVMSTAGTLKCDDGQYAPTFRFAAKDTNGSCPAVFLRGFSAAGHFAMAGWRAAARADRGKMNNARHIDRDVYPAHGSLGYGLRGS